MSGLEDRIAEQNEGLLAGQITHRHDADMWEQGRVYGHLEAEFKIMRMFGAVPSFRMVDKDDFSNVHMLASKFGFRAVGGFEQGGKLFTTFEQSEQTDDE